MDPLNTIYARIIMSRGLTLDLVGETTTNLFKPGNTVDQDKEEAAKLVEWLRDTADEWEQEFAEEIGK